jgi:hypothetical protein
VPIAREPVVPTTFVATRSMSPAGPVRWKTVAVPPTRSRTWSTTGVGTPGSVFWPSHVPPAAARGSSTGVTSPLNWFLACQVTVPRSSRKPPACASTCWATARSESTLAAVEAPCVATTS